MALVQQESNLTPALVKILSTEDALLASFNISIDSNMQSFSSMNGTYGMSMGPASVDMSLTYYLNQMADNKKTLSDLEKTIAPFLKETKGAFTGRNVEQDINGKTVVNYRLKLTDFEKFSKTANELYIKRMDAEFTAALEAKLLED